MFARFCPAHNELAAEKLLVVKFRHCALGFFDRVHLYESETFGTLIMLIADNLGVLNEVKSKLGMTGDSLKSLLNESPAEAANQPYLVVSMADGCDAWGNGHC